MERFRSHSKSVAYVNEDLQNTMARFLWRGFGVETLGCFLLAHLPGYVGASDSYASVHHAPKAPTADPASRLPAQPVAGVNS